MEEGVCDKVEQTKCVLLQFTAIFCHFSFLGISRKSKPQTPLGGRSIEGSVTSSINNAERVRPHEGNFEEVFSSSVTGPREMPRMDLSLLNTTPSVSSAKKDLWIEMLHTVERLDKIVPFFEEKRERATADELFDG